MNFITHEPAALYHSRSKSGEFLSSHLFQDYMESPELYRRKTAGEIPETESTAFVLGRAAHSLILEGKAAFEDEYIVSDGPVNPKTGEAFGKTTKAYADWKAAQKATILSGKDYSFILKLKESIDKHAEAARLLDNGEPEGVVRAALRGVPCQIRMDWFNPERGLVDLKTCEQLKWFAGDAKRFGYITQMAFYRAVIRAAAGITVPVHFIAVEKTEPHSCGVWKIDPDILDMSESIVLAGIERFRHSRETDSWSTGYEEIRLIDTL